MGIISSKFLKSDAKPLKVSAAIQTDTPKETKEIPDVRSPTADIVRTPIIVDKHKLEMDSPEGYQPMPLRNKLLKNLKLDPRSPTIGIYRTPILVEETPSRKGSPENCTSPTSIYSCNISDSVVENLMTPIESSMNVSGFEVPKSIQFDDIDLDFGMEEETDPTEKSCLKVSDKPNTYEARKLLEEIISDEENFLKKVKVTSRKAKKVAKSNDKSANDTKPKVRPPLSNITSSTNSPGNINIGIKLHSKNKVFPEFGSENSVIPNAKHMVQWDQNNTVII